MSPLPPETVYELALRLIHAGISVVPIRTDKPKAAAVEWRAYEDRLPTDNEVRTWFHGRKRGIAAIGGSVSGGLECLDFDEVGLFEKWADDLEQAMPGLLVRLVAVKTPKGGAHVWFRSDATEPNQALASRPPTKDELRERPKLKSVKRIETRGSGGYALIPGCPAECHESGKTYSYSPLGLGDLARVQKVSSLCRDTMLALCRAYNTLPVVPAGQSATPRPQGDGLTPGDDFDRRGSWQEVLEPQGWNLERGTWDEGRLTRPGKSAGVSATIGVVRGPQGEPLLHVFSSAAGIEPGTYGRFRAFTILAHNGNHSNAAKALAGRGFGERRPERTPTREQPSPSATTNAPKQPWEVKPQHGDLLDKGITAADLMRVELPPPKFAIPGLLCEGLTVLGGRPKMGKSWLTLLLGWAIAGGHDLDGRPTRQGAVLFLALEDTRRRLQSRLAMLNPALGWDFPASLTIHTAWPRADQGGLYHVAEWLSTNQESARLIIIDTLAKFRKPAKGTGNNYAEDYEALGDIKRLADLYGCSVIVIHHTRKLAAEDPFDELSGTMGITAAADGLMVLDRKRGGDDARLFVTGRDVGEQTVPMTLDRNTFRWRLGASTDGFDISGRGAGGGDDNSKVERCKAWLLDFLRVYAYPSGEIDKAGKAAGFAWSCVRDAKAALGSKGTGEVTHKNRAFSGKDWWSGIGPYESWVCRPAPGTVAENTAAPMAEEAEQGIPGYLG